MIVIFLPILPIFNANIGSDPVAILVLKNWNDVATISPRLLVTLAQYPRTEMGRHLLTAYALLRSSLSAEICSNSQALRASCFMISFV